MGITESFRARSSGILVQLTRAFIVQLCNYKRLANTLLPWWIYE